MKKFAFIGDIHSQLEPLLKAALYCKRKGLTPIFLGDLFDSRTDVSDSVGVYMAIKKLQEEMGAIVLRSNHQYKFERYAKGNNVFIADDFAKTLLDFTLAEIPVQEVADWLNTFPYGVVFRDSQDREYRCAHAMFPRWLAIPSYTDMYKVMEVTPKARDYMLYGPRVRGASWPEQEDRVFWWEEDHELGWIRVAGHYHTVFVSDSSLVLDGGMGGSCRHQEPAIPGSPDLLCLWDVEDRKLVTFP
jgi:hypothetical protein